MGQLLLSGNAYLGKFRDSDGRVEQLLPLAPDRVTVERRAGRIVFTVTNEAGRMSEHGLDDIIHVKALSSDGLVGLSPVRQMRAALALNASVRDAATALFVNHARPSGILTVNAGAGHDQLQMLKESWMAKHSGDRAGGIAVQTGDVSFTAVGMPADDAEFVAARKLSATEIARAFRIPPWMIGAEGGDSMTYANTESQALAFVVYSLQPWLRAGRAGPLRRPRPLQLRHLCRVLDGRSAQGRLDDPRPGVREGFEPGYRLDAPRRGAPPREPRT
jgi:HK97 family phage portal protein